MADQGMITKAETAYIRARIQLLSSNPFYAHLALKMGVRWMDNVGGGLSCTDGERIYIQPDVFIALPRPQQITTLVHEVLHCAAGHVWRRGSRDAFRWNVAGDVYIANIIEAESMEQVTGAAQFMRSIGVLPSDYRSMTVDQIYDTLPESLKQSQSADGSGSGDEGGKCSGNGDGQGHGCYKEAGSAAERSQAEAQWKQNVIEAGQMAGNSAGAWSELVKAAMPKPPFYLRLFEFLSRGIGGDTTWDVLNRRGLAIGEYMPSDTKMVMGEIAIAIDTSGSMSSKQLTEALGYVRGFRDQHPCKLHLIQCDYDVPAQAGYKVYDEWEQVPSEMQVEGRGGTSFDAPFALLREKRIAPKAVIYLTDGYGSVDAKSDPRCPVMWVVLQGDANFKPGFGEVIQVPI